MNCPVYSPSVAMNVSVFCLCLYGSLKHTFASGAPLPGSWMIAPARPCDRRNLLSLIVDHFHFSFFVYTSALPPHSLGQQIIVRRWCARRCCIIVLFHLSPTETELSRIKSVGFDYFRFPLAKVPIQVHILLPVLSRLIASTVLYSRV